MEVEIRPNPETGSIWAGWIIAKLYRDWPHPRNLFFGEILSETLVSVDVGDAQQSFRYLTEWLRDEGYIRILGPWAGGYQNVMLTEKSLRVLNALPSPLSTESLSSKIVDAASEVATEAGKSQLADLFGQFIGGIFKSVSS